MDDIYKLELHQRVILSIDLSVMRVPGGWLYIKGTVTDDSTTVFVPFNDEFMENQK